MAAGAAQAGAGAGRLGRAHDGGHTGTGHNVHLDEPDHGGLQWEQQLESGRHAHHRGHCHLQQQRHLYGDLGGGRVQQQCQLLRQERDRHAADERGLDVVGDQQFQHRNRQQPDGQCGSGRRDHRVLEFLHRRRQCKRNQHRQLHARWRHHHQYDVVSNGRGNGRQLVAHHQWRQTGHWGQRPADRFGQ